MRDARAVSHHLPQGDPCPASLCAVATWKTSSLLLPRVWLLSMALHHMKYLFGQFVSADLAALPLSFCPTPSIYLLYKEKALMLWRHCSAISRVLLWYQRWFSHRFKSQHIWAAVEKLHHSQTSTVHQPDSPPPCTDKPAAERSLAGSPPSASETFSCRKWDQNRTERNHMVSSKTPRWNKSQNGTWRTNFTYSSWAKNNILNISMVSFSFPLMKFALG